MNEKPNEVWKIDPRRKLMVQIVFFPYGPTIRAISTHQMFAVLLFPFVPPDNQKKSENKIDSKFKI